MRGDDLAIAAIVGLVVYAAYVYSTYEPEVPEVTDRTLYPASSLRMSENGRAELVRHEGLRRAPYKDVAGNWTVGIGHLIVPNDGLLPADHWTVGRPNAKGTAVLESMVLTDGQVQSLFVMDLETAENIVKSYVRVGVTQGMFDALTDFAFQFGQGRFASSQLLGHLNAGDYEMAADEFQRWVYAGGVRVAGLVARRQDNFLTFMA